MLRTWISRVAIMAVAGLGLAACETNDISTGGGTSQDLFVGTPTGNGLNGFGEATLSGGPSTTITTNSITPSVNYTPGTQEELRAVVGDRIFFETDRSDLNQRARGVLDQLASWMQSNPNRSIRIEGHADERGTREYNLALGDRRANAVVTYLTQRGVSSARVTTISFGKERPVANGSNATAWTQNRRAVFRVN